MTEAHGERRYRQGCRCDECRRGNMVKQKRYRLKGRQLIDSAPTIKHVLWLREQGLKRDQIAMAASVGTATIGRLCYYKPAKVHKDTAARILAVKPTSTPLSGMHDSIPTTRKIQALVAIGWPKPTIAAMVGVTQATINSIAKGKRKTTWHPVAVKVDEVFRQLRMTAGPSDAARQAAAANRWLPPLAWDDIDDVKEKPKHRHAAYEAVAP